MSDNQKQMEEFQQQTEDQAVELEDISQELSEEEMQEVQGGCRLRPTRDRRRAT